MVWIFKIQSARSSSIFLNQLVNIFDHIWESLSHYSFDFFFSHASLPLFSWEFNSIINVTSFVLVPRSLWLCSSFLSLFSLLLGSGNLCCPVIHCADFFPLCVLHSAVVPSTELFIWFNYCVLQF